MIYEIVKWPDRVLEKKADPVTKFDAELAQLVEDMWESMYAAKGIGLAAPQIGISKRITVIDVSFKEDAASKLVLINPEITETKGQQYEEEGCLSLPEIREKVKRAAFVKVRAQDVKGVWHEYSGVELQSRAFQHEIDHLDGVLFLSRISKLKKDLAVRKIRKMMAAGEW